MEIMCRQVERVGVGQQATQPLGNRSAVFFTNADVDGLGAGAAWGRCNDFGDGFLDHQDSFKNLFISL